MNNSFDEDEDEDDVAIYDARKAKLSKDGLLSAEESAMILRGKPLRSIRPDLCDD